MRTLKFVLLALFLCAAANVHAEKKPRMQSVYIFGFSASFTDSVAFLTDVMRVDSAYVTSTGFLVDRTLYSLQLENYVLESCHVPNSTNCVFFSTTKKELDKKYNKINRMYQRSNSMALIYVGEDDFRFRAQEFLDPSMFEDESNGSATGGKK